jgi:hypothetical protein
LSRLFGNKKPQVPQPPSTPTAQASTKTLDTFASRFFSLKSSSNNKQAVAAATSVSATTTPTIPKCEQRGGQSLFEKQGSMHSSSSASSSSLNHHADAADLHVPNSVLIFENRPSNLPAKSAQEELKHRHEYEKMIEAAKRKEQREKELKMKKHHQQMRKEDFMANSLRAWNTEILPNWNDQYAFVKKNDFYINSAANFGFFNKISRKIIEKIT